MYLCVQIASDLPPKYRLPAMPPVALQTPSVWGFFLQKIVMKKKKAEQVATCRIDIRLTAEEKRAIEEKARLCGYQSVSLYMRERALGARIPPSITDLTAVNQLRKVGMNLNQIAHRINMVFDKNEILSVRGYLEKLMQEINETVSKIIVK